MKLISDLDLRGHQLINVLVENIAAADLPDATLNRSRIVYDTTNNKVLYSNGTEWRDLSKADIKYKSNGVITVDGVDITVFQIAETGDVTMDASKQAMIGDNKVTNAKLAKMAAKTLKGNNTTGTANAKDLTVAEVLEMLGIDLESLNSKVSEVNVNGVSVVTEGVANIDLNTELAEFKASLKIGQANGLATLDSTGKVPATQLPSYVDDIVEVYATYTTSATGGLSNIQLYSDAAHQNAITPEGGKIYVNITEDEPPYQFRWTGSEYVAIITGGLIIGTASGTAADGGIAQEHYDNNTIHITGEERTAWNNKQNTSVTLTAATDSGINTLPTTGTTKTVTQWFQLVVNYLKSLTTLFKTHTHNGTDAPKISYNDLADKPNIPKTYKTDALTGTSGTILATTHNCGANPQVQAYLAGELVLCDIKISDGNVTWTAGEAFVAGADFRLVIQG